MLVKSVRWDKVNVGWNQVLEVERLCMWVNEMALIGTTSGGQCESCKDCSSFCKLLWMSERGQVFQK